MSFSFFHFKVLKIEFLNEKQSVTFEGRFIRGSHILEDFLINSRGSAYTQVHKVK